MANHDATTQEELDSQTPKRLETYAQKNWRPVAAIVFLIIVLFDFVIMPSIYEGHAINFNKAADISSKFKSERVQIQVFTEMTTTQIIWNPLTLRGNGMFYICFGAILGAAAWTRGQEKIEKIRYGGDYQD